MPGLNPWCLAVAIAGIAPAAADPALATAQALYQARRLDEAQTAFRQLAAEHPRNAELIYFLGKIAIRQSDYTTATELLEQAVALDPKQSDHYLWLGNAYAWTAATVPFTHKAAPGRSCLAAYRKALELNPGNLAAHFSLMNFYRHVPAFLGGGIKLARHEAGAIRQRDPALGALADAVLDLDEGKCDEAYATLSGILRKSPDDYAANCTLGRLALATRTNLVEGAAAFRRCLDLSPSENDEGHEYAQWGLGQIFECKHEAPAAFRAYEICLRINPRFKPAEEALVRLQ